MTLEAFKEFRPLPFTDNVPETIFEAFKEVKPLPFPTKSEADRVVLVLFHVRFGDCKIDVIRLLIKI